MVETTMHATIGGKKKSFWAMTESSPNSMLTIKLPIVIPAKIKWFEVEMAGLRWRNIQNQLMEKLAEKDEGLWWLVLHGITIFSGQKWAEINGRWLRWDRGAFASWNQ